jgi:hypothetical protein
VRDAACEVADRLHLLSLAQLFFEHSLLCDVLGEHEPRSSSFEVDRVRENADVDVGAVLFTMTPRGCIDTPAAQSLDGLAELGPLLLRPDLLDRHPEEFVACKAVAGYGCLVDREEEQCVQVVDPHRTGVALEEKPVTLLRATQSFRGLDARGDVAHVAREDRRAAERHSDDRELGRKLAPVRPQARELQTLAENRALPGGEIARKTVAVRVPERGRNNEIHELPPDDLASRVAEDRLRRRIELKDRSLGIDDDYSVERSFDHRVRERLALADGSFGDGDVRDVD